MTHQEINDAIAKINGLSYAMEEALIENGGEYTDEVAAMDEERAALAELLAGDGIDSLGRWLKSKEDEKAMWKAEKAAADAHIKSVDKTIAFIKKEVGRILRDTGTDKAKGTFYTFSQFTSSKTSYDAEGLDEMFLSLATDAVRRAGLPDCIDITLKTTATRLAEDTDLATLVHTETEETCKFTKPRKNEG